jgi:hypothetical protein
MSEQQKQVSIFDLPKRTIYRLTNREKEIFKIPENYQSMTPEKQSVVDAAERKREYNRQYSVVSYSKKRKRSVQKRQAMIVKFIATRPREIVESIDVCDYITERIACKVESIASDLKWLTVKGHLKRKDGPLKWSKAQYQIGDVPFNDGSES